MSFFNMSHILQKKNIERVVERKERSELERFNVCCVNVKKSAFRIKIETKIYRGPNEGEEIFVKYLCDILQMCLNLKQSSQEQYTREQCTVMQVVVLR